MKFRIKGNVECDHEWGYLDKEHRKCEICGRGEFLFGYLAKPTLSAGKEMVEDWRKVYDPGNISEEYEVDIITKKFFGGIK